MRRKYTKPEIMFEDFSLSTNIAAGCEVRTNMPTDNNCGIYLGEYVFAEGMTGCDTKISLNEAYNGICYHAPYETKNLFAS